MPSRSTEVCYRIRESNAISIVQHRPPLKSPTSSPARISVHRLQLLALALAHQVYGQHPQISFASVCLAYYRLQSIYLLFPALFPPCLVLWHPSRVLWTAGVSFHGLENQASGRGAANVCACLGDPSPLTLLSPAVRVPHMDARRQGSQIWCAFANQVAASESQVASCRMYQAADLGA